MSKLPYPGWSPNRQVVDTVDGKHRTCLVIDLRSDGPLTAAQTASLVERLEATLERGESVIPGLDTMVVTPDRFDPVVCGGLRVAREGGGA